LNDNAFIAAVRYVRFWHKADMSGSELLPRKMTVGPYSADHEPLL
jgi:hypothetical protein